MSKDRGWLVIAKRLRAAGLADNGNLAALADEHAAWLRRSGAEVIRYGRGRAWAVDPGDPVAQAWLEVIAKQGRDAAVARVHDSGAG